MTFFVLKYFINDDEFVFAVDLVGFFSKLNLPRTPFITRSLLELGYNLMGHISLSLLQDTENESFKSRV